VLVLDAEGRRARIGLSYGLRGALPPEVLERIAARLGPHAPYASVGMATLDALHELKDQMFARAAAGELPLPPEVRNRDAFQRGVESLESAAQTPDDFTRLGESGDFKQAIPESERARYAPSSDPLESAEHFLLVLAELAGDPMLALFTPGSQVQLARYAVAPFEYRKRYEASVASRPLRVISERDRAVVLSDAPARGFVPILLQQSEGVWRVDLVETWKNLFFTDGGRYVVVNRNNPYAFGLVGLPGQGWHVLDPLDLEGRTPQQAIDELEAELAHGDDPALHFRLAEILFRNCFAAVDALSHYEAAARGASNVHTYVWTMAERASYLGLYQQAIPFYEVLGTGAFERLGDAYYALGDYRSAAGYYEGALDHGGDRGRIADRIEKARRGGREG
jgi:tetratricopeptide (TPR) repeat protein